jgi:hypothetical protein
MSTEGYGGSVDRFLSEIERLTTPQWTQVSVRFLESEEAIRTAVEEPSQLAQEIVMGRLPSADGRTKDQRREAMKQANTRAQTITAALPEKVERAGKDFPLRKLASEAVWHAMRALLVREELEARRGGPELVTMLLKQFDGLVTPP